jgi:hypothetical protein
LGSRFGAYSQFRLEAADAKTDQRRFHAIDNPRAFTDQAFALARLGRLASSSSSVGIATILQ